MCQNPSHSVIWHDLLIWIRLFWLALSTHNSNSLLILPITSSRAHTNQKTQYYTEMLVLWYKNHIYNIKLIILRFTRASRIAHEPPTNGTLYLLSNCSKLKSYTSQAIAYVLCYQNELFSLVYSCIRRHIFRLSSYHYPAQLYNFCKYPDSRVIGRIYNYFSLSTNK